MSPGRPNKTPYAEEWLAFEEQTGGRFCCHGTVQEVRQQFDALGVQLTSLFPPPTNEVVTVDHKTDEGVAVRLYKPANAATGLPTGLYIHSGGWSCGSIDNEDHLTRQLALAVPCMLVSVEYRLAPESPFPAAPDDCVSAYKWMATAASRLGGDATKLFITGGSAGGNLSITTALRIVAEDKDVPRPSGLFALCPAVVMAQAVAKLPDDLKAFENPPETYADAAMIDKATIETCCDAYIGSTDPSYPLLSPIFHHKLSALPPVYLTTSNKDPLNDDAFMFQHKLKQVGVECTLKEYDGYPHFFHMLPQLEMSVKFMTDLAAAIRERCRGDVYRLPSAGL